MAGTNLYWGRAETELRELAEALGIPVFLNGLGRGCLPPDHELYFARARGSALQGCDVALVIGVPLDFRLGFGGSFGEESKLIQLDFAPSRLEKTRQPDLALSGDIGAALSAIRESVDADPHRTSAWVNRLRVIESEKRAEEQEMLDDDRSPLHPMRVYRELGDFLDRDAIVVGDGGDFVSFAGRVWETWEPGTWMDPGPYGCLGAGPGQAIGAKLAHPERQVCLLLGDGAFGFSGMEFDTMARHNLPIVAVMGNNGIWALEHHPMKFLYGYSLAAELRPGDPLRRGRLRPRLPRRAGALSGRAPPGTRPRLRLGQAGVGQRDHRPRGRLPAQGESGLVPEPGVPWVESIRPAALSLSLVRTR